MDMLLIIVLVIIGGFALHGYIRGLIRIVFSLVAIVIAIGLASCIAPYMAGFLQTQTTLQDTIQEKLRTAMQSKAEEEMQSKVQEGATVFGIEIPEEIQEFLSGNVIDGASDIMEESGIYDQLAGELAEAAVQRIAWALSFIVVMILLMVLVHMLDIIAKLPVLNSINHIGGLAIGLVQGIIIVWILLFIIELCRTSSWGNQMMESIYGNAFLKLLYENNLIEQLVGSILI